MAVKVIADSISSVTGKRFTTFEFEFPRIVLAEFNTHNAISKNSSSSRAIPVPTMIEQVRSNPAFPVRFGAANKGMQDSGEHDELVELELGTIYHCGPADYIWAEAGLIVADIAEAYHDAGYAKQICNRLLETFQTQKVVASATDWNNFLWLRDHKAADPTIEKLAKEVKEALDESEPVVLHPGQWHVPYYNDGHWMENKSMTELNNGIPTDAYGHVLEHALTISASCCAMVSYRKLDDSIEKARSVVAKLNLNGEEPDQPVHASPLEHQGTPIDYSNKWDNTNDGVNVPHLPHTWEEGITHMDRDGMFGSGNLKGWIQRRQQVPNHVKRG